ncbi:MAG: phosphoglycerate kinase [Chitinophagales bacterium]
MESLRDVDVKNKRVLVRVDFNVPIDKRGDIIDDTRIRASIPTIQYLIDQGAKVIVASHLGRPKGETVERYRMDKLAEYLGLLLKRKVVKAPDCVGPEVQKIVDAMQPGDVVMLENVRFHPEEEKNNPEFCRSLAESADIYVNDAFGTAHRAHASTAGVAAILPAYPGFLLEKEVSMLQKVLEGAEKPRVAIVGGAKVSDKLSLLENLLVKMDAIIIGGGMANTFLKASGLDIGKSLCEDSLLDTARHLIKKAGEAGIKIFLPIDVVITEKISDEAESKTVPVEAVPPEWMIVDIGPQTVQSYCNCIKQAATIFWNGPMGVYEVRQFSLGTEEIARAVAETHAVSVVGGGDSLAAVFHVGVQDKITHISTGGGATLEFLEGRELPGVAGCYLKKKVG